MEESVTVEKFRELFETRDTVAAEWKKTGRKIVGCVSTYTPEEVIYAAEALPMGVLEKAESFSKADAYLPSFACSFMRGLLETLLGGRYGYFDLVALPSLCDSMRGFYGIWKKISDNPYTYLLHYPTNRSEEALEYFAEEVERFKNFMEKLAGKEISEKDLRKAVEVYNENRKLLKKLYWLRRSESPPISGVEALEVVLSSMTTPKNLHNQFLEKLLSEITKRKEYPEGEARLLVSGHIIDDPEVLKVIEESGGIVVSDDLDSGSRYFWSLVDTEAKPIEGISRRYIKIPSPYGSPITDRIKYLKAMIKAFQIEGVVFLTRKFCEPYLFDYVTLGRAVKEEDIPSLYLEYEYPLARGALKTRVEAFIEMLR
jgi:benzoyl-CoA reductase subunit C